MEQQLIPYADPLCIPLLHRAILAREHLPFKQYPPQEDVYASSFIEASLPAESCPVAQFFKRIIADDAWTQRMLAAGNKLILLGPGDDHASVPGEPEGTLVTGKVRIHRLSSMSTLTLLCVGPDGRVNPLDESVMPLDDVLGSGATLDGAASTFVAPTTDSLAVQEAAESMRAAKSQVDDDASNEQGSSSHDSRERLCRTSMAEMIAMQFEYPARADYNAQTILYNLKMMNEGRTDFLPFDRQPVMQDPLPTRNTAGQTLSMTERIEQKLERKLVKYAERSANAIPRDAARRGTKRTVDIQQARNIKPAYRGIRLEEAYFFTPAQARKWHESSHREPKWVCNVAIALSFESLREPLWMEYDSYLPWLGWRRVRAQPDAMAGWMAARDADFEVVRSEQRQPQVAYAMLEQGRSVVGRAVAEEVWDWGGAESGDCLVLTTTCTIRGWNAGGRTTAGQDSRRNVFFHLRGVVIGGE